MLIQSQAHNAYSIRPRISQQTQSNEKSAADRFFNSGDTAQKTDTINIASQVSVKPALKSAPARLQSNPSEKHKPEAAKPNSVLNAYIRPDAFSGATDSTKHIGVVLDILA